MRHLTAILLLACIGRVSHSTTADLVNREESDRLTGQVQLDGLQSAPQASPRVYRARETHKDGFAKGHACYGLTVDEVGLYVDLVTYDELEGDYQTGLLDRQIIMSRSMSCYRLLKERIFGGSPYNGM